MNRPTITVNNTGLGGQRRWSWCVRWGVDGPLFDHGISGHAHTRLGARFAAWRAAR